MVLGRIINQVQDASGKITVSVWKATDALTGIHDFQVDVDTDWVCIGGGGTGRELSWMVDLILPLYIMARITSRHPFLQLIMMETMIGKDGK